MLKIWHISDSHTYANQLSIPENIDIFIHSGDLSNSKASTINNNEVREELEWIANLNIPYKVIIAGNHDTSIERGLIKRSELNKMGITYLFNESVQIKGIKIWGSPFTPSFGVGWAFNKKRDKLYNLWSSIPEDTDIVITHGPPKGILDNSYAKEGNLYERCGCAALIKRILRIQPKIVCFGHIHNCKDIINAGTIVLSSYPNIIFSNGSIVTDGKFGELSSNGNILYIENKQ